MTLSVLRDVTEEEERFRLADMRRQSQKMEAGAPAGGVAHDFNNLLMAISGYGQLLASLMPPDHAGCADLEEILKAAERGTSFTHQLLAFSRRQGFAAAGFWTEYGN